MTPKEKYFKRIYDNADTIECACGCGQKLKNKDRYGRDKKYINGHNGRKYNDPSQYKREWNHRNRKQRQEYKRKWSHSKKIEFIEKLGGKCNICGVIYDGTNAPIFDFHHRDPKEKKIALNLTSITRYSISTLEKELNKCDLLCSNCHRTIGSSY